MSDPGRTPDARRAGEASRSSYRTGAAALLGPEPLRIVPLPRRTALAALPGRGALHLIERHARAYRHSWTILISGFFEPLFYLLSVGVGIGGLVGTVTGPHGRVSYASFVAPALLATSAMNGAVLDSTYNVFFLLKYAKLYESALSTPMRPSDLAIGQVAWALIRGGLYSVAFMVVMLAMGLAHSVWAVAAVPAALLVSFAFGGAGMAGTTYMRSWQHFEYVILATLPMFLFSATFYPLTFYPVAVRVIIQCTPLYQGVVLLRGLTLGAVTPSLLIAVGYLAVMGTAGLVIASRRISRLLLI